MKMIPLTSISTLLRHVRLPPPLPKMETEIGSHLHQVRTVRMRDIDERIQVISSELLPSLVVTPDGTISEADIR